MGNKEVDTMVIRMVKQYIVSRAKFDFSSMDLEINIKEKTSLENKNKYVLESNIPDNALYIAHADLSTGEIDINIYQKVGDVHVKSLALPTDQNKMG